MKSATLLPLNPYIGQSHQLPASYSDDNSDVVLFPNPCLSYAGKDTLVSPHHQVTGFMVPASAGASPQTPELSLHISAALILTLTPRLVSLA